MITLLRNELTGRVESAKAALYRRSDGYACPGCGVPMYVAESPRGVAHGRCYPGVTHQAGCPCVGLESSKSCIDIDAIDLDYLTRAIMTPPGTGGGGGGDDPPRPPKSHDAHEKKLDSLRHIFQLGLCEIKDCKITSQIWLHDFLLNRATVYRAMSSNEDLGTKAVVAKPEYRIDSNMVIRFAVCTSIKAADGWEKAMKILDMRFHDREQYEKIANKLFVKATDSIKGYRWLPRFSWVLVYGDWKGLPYGDCKQYCRKNCATSWRCTGYQSADCTVPAHQIYCPPTNKIR